MKGYKHTELGWIPEDWGFFRFRDVCKVNQGLQIPIEERLKEPVHNSKVYITIQYLNEGKVAEYILNANESVCCNEDDILMTRTGNTGIVISGVSGVFHNNFFKIKYNRGKIDKTYLIEYLSTQFIKHLILVKAGTGTIPDLNHNDFYSIPVVIPPISEQKRISQILLTWNKTIELLSQSIVVKQQLKKGLMQQLLTGKKRLAGFNGKWKPVEFGKVFDFIRTESFSRENITKDKDNSGILYIHYGDIHALYNGDHLDLNTENRIPSLNKEIEIKNGFELLRDGDLIIADASEDYEGVGECTEIVNIGKKKVIGGLHTIVARDNNGLTSLGYRAFILKNPEVALMLKKLAVGSSVYGISKGSLSGLKIKLPSLQEQKAIASVLTHIEDEIQLREKQLEIYKEQKQGLMQQLLTGKKRVKG